MTRRIYVKLSYGARKAQQMEHHVKDIIPADLSTLRLPVPAPDAVRWINGTEIEVFWTADETIRVAVLAALRNSREDDWLKQRMGVMGLLGLNYYEDPSNDPPPDQEPSSTFPLARRLESSLSPPHTYSDDSGRLDDLCTSLETVKMQLQVALAERDEARERALIIDAAGERLRIETVLRDAELQAVKHERDALYGLIGDLPWGVPSLIHNVTKAQDSSDATPLSMKGSDPAQDTAPSFALAEQATEAPLSVTTLQDAKNRIGSLSFAYNTAIQQNRSATLEMATLNAALEQARRGGPDPFLMSTLTKISEELARRQNEGIR